MSAYRVKHKATGLFYCRSRNVRYHYVDDQGRKQWAYTKSNLSTKGKIYPSIPSSSWYTGSIYNHIALQKLIDNDPQNWRKSTRRSTLMTEPSNVTDWEVEDMAADKDNISKKVQDLLNEEPNKHMKAKTQRLAKVARNWALKGAVDQSIGYFQRFDGYVAGAQAVLREQYKVNRKPVALKLDKVHSIASTPRIGALVIYIKAYIPQPGDARGERTLVYLGEIPNMPGHGIFAGGSGKIHIGYHIEDFREATEEEV